jgi:anti-anti-sigma factor
MLDIDMEFKKGILFVRLNGELLSHNCILLDNKINELILSNSVRFIAFNVSSLNYIDNTGIDTISKYTLALSKINGKALLCGVNNKLVKGRVKNSPLSYLIEQVSDELGAVNYINLGGYL